MAKPPNYTVVVSKAQESVKSVKKKLVKKSSPQNFINKTLTTYLTVEYHINELA